MLSVDRKIQWVRQEDKYGCVIASIAMVTGKTYSEVKAMFTHHSYDFSKSGLGGYDTDQCLAELGFATSRLYVNTLQGRRPESEWPPQPFTGMHICQVIVNENSQQGHSVVMLADGKVLDPETPEPKRLTDYYRVNNVAGVVPV
jgi:hypothetical protein